MSQSRGVCCLAELTRTRVRGLQVGQGLGVPLGSTASLPCWGRAQRWAHGTMWGPPGLTQPRPWLPPTSTGLGRAGRYKATGRKSSNHNSVMLALSRAKIYSLKRFLHTQNFISIECTLSFFFFFCWLHKLIQKLLLILTIFN